MRILSHVKDYIQDQWELFRQESLFYKFICLLLNFVFLPGFFLTFLVLAGYIIDTNLPTNTKLEIGTVISKQYVPPTEYFELIGEVLWLKAAPEHYAVKIMVNKDVAIVAIPKHFGDDSEINQPLRIRTRRGLITRSIYINWLEKIDLPDDMP